MQPEGHYENEYQSQLNRSEQEQADIAEYLKHGLGEDNINDALRDMADGYKVFDVMSQEKLDVGKTICNIWSSRMTEDEKCHHIGSIIIAGIKQHAVEGK